MYQYLLEKYALYFLFIFLNIDIRSIANILLLIAQILDTSFEIFLYRMRFDIHLKKD